MWNTAFSQSGQCEGGTPGSHHSEGLCLDAGHRPLVSRGGMSAVPTRLPGPESKCHLLFCFLLGRLWEGKRPSRVRVGAWPAEQTETS